MNDPNDEPTQPGRKKKESTGGVTPGHEEAAAPGPIDPQTGQHTSYWVLSAEERRKGFIRPLRHVYKHVGIRPTHATTDLTDSEKEHFKKWGYVAFEQYPEESERTGRYWTEEQLKSGCGGETRMSQKIAETYARQPNFYGATFCVNCRKHISVEEFVWVGRNGEETADRVGS